MFNNKYIHKIKYNIKQNINHINYILFTYFPFEEEDHL